MQPTENPQMHNYPLSKLFLIPLLLCLSFLTHADNTYSNIYIFGDSLSDTGNLGSVIGGIPAPYYENRISNGPVGVETLTAKFGYTADASLHLLGLNAGNNYSVAGAKASTNEAIDLNTQILSFQANHASIAPKDALYVIYIGGNDVRAALFEADPTISNSIIKTANKNVKNAIVMLKRMGARSFLVINVPNIGLIPETRLIAIATNNPDFINHATELTIKYNKTLHHMIDELEDDNEHEHTFKIKEFSLFKLFDMIVEKSIYLGFTNNSEACFRSRIPDFHPDCNYGLNADQFIFFDEIHPTKRVHTMFGEAFIKAISNNKKKKKEKDKNHH